MCMCVVHVCRVVMCMYVVDVQSNDMHVCGTCAGQ